MSIVPCWVSVPANYPSILIGGKVESGIFTGPDVPDQRNIPFSRDGQRLIQREGHNAAASVEKQNFSGPFFRIVPKCVGDDRATAVTYEARLGLGRIPTDRAGGRGGADAQDVSESVRTVENIHSQVVTTSDQVPPTGRELDTCNGIVVLTAESGQKLVRVGVTAVSHEGVKGRERREYLLESVRRVSIK